MTVTAPGTPLAADVAVSITVLNANRRPEIEFIPNSTVQRGQVLDVPVRVTDADGNVITITAVSAIPGFSIPYFAVLTDNGDGTGLLRFTPGAGDRGDYSISVSASDDGDGGGDGAVLVDTVTFVVSVESENDPPVLAYVGDRVAVADDPFELVVRSDDLDGESLTFSVTGLPPAATLTPGAVYGTAVLNWTPQASDVGDYSVEVSVTDEGNGNPLLIESDAAAFTLTVRQANSAPQLDPVGDPTVAEGETLTVSLTPMTPTATTSPSVPGISRSAPGSTPCTAS